MLKSIFLIFPILLFAAFISGCSENASTEPQNPPVVRDPNTAPKASIDRFSAEAGNLFVRDGSNNLPGPNQPINFDTFSYLLNRR